LSAHRQQFAVIGLGPFARTLCQSLLSLGHEVLAVDPRAEVVQEFHDAGLATHAIQADPESPIALRELDLLSFDAVIVARGTDFEASLLTVTGLLDLGVKQVIAKAASDRHAQVLERVGGDRVRVVNPEHEMGLRLANQLVGQDIMEAVWVDPHVGFAEKPLPEAWVGLSLADTRLRTRTGLLLIAVRRAGRYLFAPDGALVFEAGDRLVLLGPNDASERFGK
jgi:trk system potassium uptake protein TrkA